MPEPIPLHRVGIFAGVPDSELAAVVAVASRRTFAPGQVFFKMGDRNGSLYIICDGKVRVSRWVGEEDVPLATLEAGQTFGEMSILDGSPASATLAAVETTEVLEITREALEKVFLDRPAVYGRVWYNLACELKRRLSETNSLVASYVDISRALVDDPEFRAYYSRL